VAAIDPSGGWQGWIAALHFNFLLGRTGRLGNGVGAVLLLVMCLTGAILWLPPVASRWWLQARGRLRIEPGAPWRKLMWQMHHAIGAVSLLFIALLSVTGTYFIWSQSYVRVVSRWFERTTEPKPAAHEPNATVLPVAELARLARQALPGLPLHRLQIVEQPSQTVRVTLRHGEPEEFHLVSTVFLDPVTGAVLKTNPLARRPWGDAVLSWFSALHFGAFGGWPIRVLWFVLGLSLPALAISGLAMWWFRVLRPRLQTEWTRESKASTIKEVSV
jgi:uncharacterized iron-regulated membrane protein